MLICFESDKTRSMIQRCFVGDRHDYCHIATSCVPTYYLLILLTFILIFFWYAFVMWLIFIKALLQFVCISEVNRWVYFGSYSSFYRYRKIFHCDTFWSIAVAREANCLATCRQTRLTVRQTTLWLPETCNVFCFKVRSHLFAKLFEASFLTSSDAFC